MMLFSALKDYKFFLIRVLYGALLLGCKANQDISLQNTVLENQQKIFQIHLFEKSIDRIHSEFSFICLGCHKNEEYVEGEGTNSIYQEEFLLSHFYQARYPEQNPIILKVMDEKSHSGGVMCADFYFPECTILISEWLNLFGEQKKLKIGSSPVMNKIKRTKEGVIEFNLTEEERFYLYESWPFDAFNLKDIIVSKKTIEASKYWGGALVTKDFTYFIEF